MKSDAAEARYTASGPTSSGSPMRRAGTLDRNSARVCLVGHGLARDVGVHVAGRQAVDLDPVARPLGGEASRERFHRRLARAVGGVAGDADRAVHRADIDDLARPRAIMPGATARASRNIDVRLVASTPSHSSSVTSIVLFSSVMPALLTRTSTGPSAASISRTARSISVRRVTSSVKPPARPPDLADLVGRRLDLVRRARAAGHAGARRAERRARWPGRSRGSRR